MSLGGGALIELTCKSKQNILWGETCGENFFLTDLGGGGGGYPQHTSPWIRTCFLKLFGLICRRGSICFSFFFFVWSIFPVYLSPYKNVEGDI